MRRKYIMSGDRTIEEEGGQGRKIQDLWGKGNSVVLRERTFFGTSKKPIKVLWKEELSSTKQKGNYGIGLVQRTKQPNGLTKPRTKQ